MTENEVERSRAKQDWFLEHGSIQAELMKLKREATRKKVDEDGKKCREGPGTDGEDGRKDERTTLTSEREVTTDVPAGPNGGQPEVDTTPERPKVDRVDEVVKEVEGDGDEDRPRRLPAGKIPTAPDLSSKIASVIQLENKLKRRKYEMERNNRLKAGNQPPEGDSAATEEPRVRSKPSSSALEGDEASKEGPIADSSEAGPMDDVTSDAPKAETVDVSASQDGPASGERPHPCGPEAPSSPDSPDRSIAEDDAVVKEGHVHTHDTGCGREVEDGHTEDGTVGPTSEGAIDNEMGPGVDNGLEKEESGTAAPRPRKERIRNGTDGSEWLEVRRKTKSRGRPGSEPRNSSPLGRIMNIFRKKGK